MKIARSTVTVPKVVSAAPSEPKTPVVPMDRLVALYTGDRIEFSVTHEIEADGEKAWVKYGVNSSVAEGETATDASARVVGFVNQIVMEAATMVAKQMLEG
jgi:hypothetical protein